MRRTLLILALIGVLSSCGSDGKGASPTTTVGTCTAEAARELDQHFITASKFDVGCAKVVAGKTVFFTNNDDATHTVSTVEGAPEKIDAELPKKGSTFSHTFTTPGEYKITCRRHNETLTLFVV